jgi:U4/U6 small nuclear ribonucleoprotein PRP31
MSEVDLSGILPSATIMVVTVTASTTIGTMLSEATLKEVTEACEQVLGLSEHKQRMLSYVESRMSTVAPNLSALVGTTIAAKLIGQAGGLNKLASLPSTVLQVLGSKKRSLSGMGTSQVMHGGFIQHCDLVLNTPPALRNKVLRLVAGKSTLAARVDTFADKGGGVIGRGFKDEIEMRATKLQEPAPHREVKALPVPPESSGKRRGGRRLRKMKERYGMSQMRQLTNRVQFGQEEDTTSDGLLGVGMLGKGQQTGKLRVTAKDQKLLAEKNKKARTAGSSGSTNGLASSLAFTPVQGIELVNPNQRQDSAEGTETYFSKQAAFFARGM